MSRMNDLVVHIDEFAMQDGRLAECLEWIINLHIQDSTAIPFNMLPKEAQLCYGLYEQEKKLIQHADEQAKQWEVEHKQNIHTNIQSAVEEGRLTYDQGMMLIDNPEEADRWDRDGMI